MTTNRPKNRFLKGSGSFTCDICGKRTRSTGRGDNENIGLCVACFDECGHQNTHSDEGHDEPGRADATCPICRGEMADMSGVTKRHLPEIVIAAPSKSMAKRINAMRKGQS